MRSCTSGRQFLRRSVTLNKSVLIFCALLLSPSMRRVWIEIKRQIAVVVGQLSPSMRRVWIEMAKALGASEEQVVTLHAEGVD